MFRAILLVWLGGVLCGAGTVRAETITVATGDWPPSLEEKARHHGYSNHMVKLAFASQGVDVKILFLPWKRAYEATKKGKYHCTNHWYCTPRRESDFFCADSILIENYMLFHLKTRQVMWETLDDLKAYKFGLTLGYTYSDEFVKMVNGGEIQGEWIPTDVQNFTKLLKGRIDIVPIAEAVGLYLLNRDFPPEQRARITYNTRPLVIQTAHLLFPKSRADSKKYLALYNKGIELLKADGTLENYYDKMIMGWYSK